MTAEALSSGDDEASVCPHCHKPFDAPLLEGGPERHRGFKCPHCRLFVPESRTEDGPALEDDAR